MAMYNLKNGRIEVVKETAFKLEADIQSLVETNLSDMLGLDFVKSQFTVSGSVQPLRIDTLAFDPKIKAFVIIEYKQGRSFSVVDQGYAYLAVMLNNKADFILEYNDRGKTILKRNQVDWSQSRVIFISQSFTSYQKEAINLKDLPIALWEIKRYGNGAIHFEEIRKLSATESIKTISKANSAVGVVNKEVVVYSEQDHFEGIPPSFIELYEELKEKVLELGEVEIKVNKHYISFTSKGSNFVDVQLLNREGVRIVLNLAKGKLNDPYKLTRDLSGVGHLGNGDYACSFKTSEKLDYIVTLVKQAYLAKA